jgi:hypothetical protein
MRRASGLAKMRASPAAGAGCRPSPVAGLTLVAVLSPLAG